MVLLFEYRIMLPFTVDEYHIGQLFMTAKTSCDFSSNGEGIEVLVNEDVASQVAAQSDELKPAEKAMLVSVGDSTRYTKKIFHLRSYLPDWLKLIAPSFKSVAITEESWNSYPFCKTVFHCYDQKKWKDSFRIEVTTIHKNDFGSSVNVHCLSPAELKTRKVKLIDVVNDKISAKEYSQETDPLLFRSGLDAYAHRTPLTKEWLLGKYDGVAAGTGASAVRVGNGVGSGGGSDCEGNFPLMCAYKLVKVKYSSWIFGSKIEQAIQDYGFKDVLLSANRKNVCWMDEWMCMSMEEVRQFEKSCADIQNELVSHAPTEEMMSAEEKKEAELEQHLHHGLPKHHMDVGPPRKRSSAAAAAAESHRRRHHSVGPPRHAHGAKERVEAAVRYAEDAERKFEGDLVAEKEDVDEETSVSSALTADVLLCGEERSDVIGFDGDANCKLEQKNSLQ